MTLSQSELSELLEAVRAGGGIDVVRRGVELVLQALISAEASEFIGAQPFERTASRTNLRNGTRERLLSTKAGDVQLQIPKVRRGSFPAVLERRRRIDRALFAVVMEAYVHGVSTRKVDDLVQALGLQAGISKSEVSRICPELDESLDVFRHRSLAHTGFPYVFLDATYLKLCRTRPASPLLDAEIQLRLRRLPASPALGRGTTSRRISETAPVFREVSPLWRPESR